MASGSSGFGVESMQPYVVPDDESIDMKLAMLHIFSKWASKPKGKVKVRHVEGGTGYSGMARRRGGRRRALTVLLVVSWKLQVS